MPPAKPPIFSEDELEAIREILAVLGDGRVGTLRDVLEWYRNWRWFRQFVINAVMFGGAAFGLFTVFKEQVVALIRAALGGP